MERAIILVAVGTLLSGGCLKLDDLGGTPGASATTIKGITTTTTAGTTTTTAGAGGAAAVACATNAPAGTSCSVNDGQVCDGQGNCVVALVAQADTMVRTDWDVRRDDNYGRSECIGVGTSRGGGGIPVGGADAVRSFIRFDLSSVPLHHAIARARLRLTVRGFDEYAAAPGLTFQVDVHRVVDSGSRTPWVEGNGIENNCWSKTGCANPGAPDIPAGWTNVDDAHGVVWAGMGDNSSADAANNITQPDFDPAVEAGVDIVQVQTLAGATFDWDVTPLVRDWQRNTVPNFGVVLRDPTEDSPPAFRGILFGSVEGETFDIPNVNSGLLLKLPGPRLLLELCGDLDDDGACDG